MGFLFLIIFIVGFVSLISSFGSGNDMKCNGHKWTYENDHMICSVCKKRPGQL